MSTANLHNEQELLQRLASGDEDAFTTIYRFYSSTIFNTAMIFLKDEAESQEIVQEVFVRCWEYREKMRAVRSLRNYFFIATRNRVFDQLTRNIRAKKALLGLREQISSSSEDSIPQLLQQKEYSYLIEQAILELPPQQKQVYRMAEEQALSYDEIAAQLSLSKFTVKKHMELARKFVRGFIRVRVQYDLILPLLTLLTIEALGIFKHPPLF